MDTRKMAICFCGDANVGKTTFVTRVTCDYFDPSSIATVGIDFRILTVSFTPLDAVDDEMVPAKRVRVTIWDTAGQERYRSIIKSYFRQKDVIVVMYAVDNQQTFDNVDTWIETARELASRDAFFVLVGTKADTVRTVSTEDGRRKAKRHGFTAFMETSSKQDIAGYITPLEVMKKIAQNWWSIRQCGRVSEALDPGVVLDDSPPTSKKCGC